MLKEAFANPQGLANCAAAALALAKPDATKRLADLVETLEGTS
jgi:UDP-N-acetylglucosamine--N-acetylmuramyl-(pentapeptide) pyrophosphoryl-undecaprenol N-acetylglucosamine transferase